MMNVMSIGIGNYYSVLPVHSTNKMDNRAGENGKEKYPQKRKVAKRVGNFAGLLAEASLAYSTGSFDTYA